MSENRRGRIGAGDAIEEMDWPTPPAHFKRQHAPNRSESKIRLVVGQTGSGKSRELAESLIRARRISGHYVVHDRDPLWGRSLRNLAERTGQDSVEFWRQVWRAAFLGFQASVIAREHLYLLEEDHRLKFIGLHALRTKNDELLLNDRGVMTRPVAQINAYAARVYTSGFFYDDSWDMVSAALDDIREKLPPIQLFIESPEDGWRTEPALMLNCAEGLARQVLADDSNGSPATKMTVMAATRTAVLMKMQQDEGRYRRSERVLPLDWSPGELKQFVNARLKKNADHHTSLSGRLAGPFERLTGLNTIGVEERGGIKEGLTHYVLRHCAQPRDVLNVANALIQSRNHTGFDKPMQDLDVKHIVAIEADAIGNEMVNQTATALSGRIRDDPAKTTDTKSMLLDWLHALGTDVFPAASLQTAIATWPHAGTRSILADQLWQNGMVAVLDRHRRATFFNSAAGASHLSRTSEAAYSLHPSMIDLLGIEPDPAPISIFEGGIK